MPEQAKRTWTDNLAPIIWAASALVAVIVSLLVIRDSAAPLEKLKLATGYALLIFLFFLSMVVLLQIIQNKIDLSEMLDELSGGASMSRFQLLVFTFVIAFSFFVVVANQGGFPEIPTNVLALLGVSASTYAVSKGLQVASGDTEAEEDRASGPEASSQKNMNP